MTTGCHLCGGAALRDVDGFAALARVTSDCKPWAPGGRLAVCDACGGVQKPTDARWHDEAAAIYRQYTIYFQAGGAEQPVFVGSGAQPIGRSERLVRCLADTVSLPARGRLLDVGCGNGAFLRAFAAAMPGWTLAGTELSDANRGTIESIPGVEALYTCAPNAVPGTFQVVSLVHALEHIADPAALLRLVADRLAADGLLFVEVPSAVRNPFDLVIADHATHFTLPALRALLQRAGFASVAASETWVTKEISVLARRQQSEPPAAGTDTPWAGAALEWLRTVRDGARAAQRAAGGRPFGLFGSSIAATWLAQELDGAVDFFVDEDVTRHGRTFMERPIVSPAATPSGSAVFVGLGGGLALLVADRLMHVSPSVSWIPAGAAA